MWILPQNLHLHNGTGCSDLLSAEIPTRFEGEINDFDEESFSANVKIINEIRELVYGYGIYYLHSYTD